MKDNICNTSAVTLATPHGVAGLGMSVGTCTAHIEVVQQSDRLASETYVSQVDGAYTNTRGCPAMRPVSIKAYSPFISKLSEVCSVILSSFHPVLKLYII